MENLEFTTSDTNLAAALMSEGYPLLKSHHSLVDSRRVEFVIGCSPEVGRKAKMDLLNGVTLVNLREYLSRVKILKDIIYGK